MEPSYGRPSNFRASVYPTAQLNSPPARSNTLFSASGAPITSAMARLLDKQREVEAFERIATQAAGLRDYFEQFAGQYNALEEGSQGQSDSGDGGGASTRALPAPRRPAL